MNHKIFGRKLGRDIKERTALFRSLANALIDHGKITTTLAKAQALRPQIEKAITHAKKKSVQSVRQITSFLNNPKNVRRLVDEIAPQMTMSGGYIRIYRLGTRMGDNAQQVVLQWVTHADAAVAPRTTVNMSPKQVESSPKVEKQEEPKAKAPAKKRVAKKKV